MILDGLAEVTKHAMKIINLLLVLTISACSTTVPLAPHHMDLEAKTLAVPEGMSRVYVIRDSAFTGALHSVEVAASTKYLSKKTYTFFDLEPGDHQFTFRSAQNLRQLDLSTVAGDIFFVHMQDRIGAGTGDMRTVPALVDREKGIELLLTSSLIN